MGACCGQPGPAAWFGVVGVAGVVVVVLVAICVVVRLFPGAPQRPDGAARVPSSNLHRTAIGWSGLAQESAGVRLVKETTVTIDTAPRPIPVTLVHSPACHFCDDAAEVLRELAGEYAIDVSVVEIDSALGATLVAVHRPAMNPLVVVDGVFFSSGRLPRKKLVKLLESRGARRPARVGG